MGVRRARVLLVLLATSAALASACGARPGVSKSATPPRSVPAAPSQPGADRFPLSGSRQAVDLAFPTPEVGWLAVTGSPVSGEEPTRTEVLRTNDRGVHWRPQWSGTGSPAQFVAIGVQQAFLVLHPNTTCPRGSPSWCATHQLATNLLSTRDGGRSWTLIWSSSAQLSAISFAGRALGLGVMEKKPCPEELPASGAPNCPGDLVRTVDGGRRWSTVLHTPGPILAVTHMGARTWWAVQSVTSSGDKPAQPGGRLVIWESHDGGISWAERGKIEGPALAFLSPRAEAQLLVGRHGQVWLSMVDPESCAMHGCGTVGVWHSSSGGRTWAVTPAVDRQAGCGPSSNLPLAVSPGGLAYVATGANLAACAPPAGTLARWDGEHWQKVHTWSFAAVTSVSWPSAATGYVLAGGALARSVDDGRTWSQAWPSVAPLGPLAPLSAEVAIGAGDTIDPGVVLRTTDRGATWRPIADLAGYVTAIDYPTARDGFVVLLDPVRSTWDLVASDNGGHSWSVRAALPGRGRGPRAPQGVSGLWMVSPSKGLVLTTSGASEFDLDGVAPARLWSTSDGGRTWDRVGAVPTSPYWDLGAAGFARSSQDHWWGVVEGGSVSAQETTYASGTWRYDRRFPTLDEVQVIDPQVIVGWQETDNGTAHTMLVSDDGGADWRRQLLPRAATIPALGAMASLAFVNADDGWWSAGGYVWTTNDGGAQWRR